MCGLSGIMSFKPAADRLALHHHAQTMIATLHRRGPDDHGVWIDPDAPLALAHRRLSIVDLSPEGHQPMRSPSGAHAIVFNGEIYNFLALRADLEEEGATFRGRTDTEVLLNAVERWGLDKTLERIEGMFALALWDRRARTLHLVRDRMGKKPLYVGWAGDDLMFGSELKALRAHPAFVRAVSPACLAAYLRTGWIAPPHSIYKSVWSVPPGMRLTVPHTVSLNAPSGESGAPGSDLAVRMRAYWSAREVAMRARTVPVRLSEAEALRSFDRVFETCVRERMVADVPLGAFLSGGVDSSAVVTMMQRLSPRPVKTYTIGFDDRTYDEARHAEAMARHLGTDHHTAHLDGAQALKIVPRLPEMYDEPFADASAIPMALLCAFARRDVTVALSGDGGDEMFGGYHRYVTGARLHARARWVPRAVRGALSRAILARTPEWWNARLTRIPQAGQKLHKVAHAYLFDTPGDIHRALLSLWPDPAALVPGARVPDFEPDLPPGLTFSEEMMLRDALTYLPADVLVKVDRASMDVALEARAPFLDRRMFNFAWSLPQDFKIRRGRGKWIVRAWLDQSIPAACLDRPKQGFTPPVGAWIRGPLRGWAEELLTPAALQACGLEPAPVRRTWAAHLAGQGDHAARLWAVLTLSAWQTHAGP